MAAPRDGLGDPPRPGPDDRAVPRAPSRAGGAAVARGRDDAYCAGPARAAPRRAPGSRASRRGPNRASAFGSPASGFDSEWSWRLEPVAGGTRVDPRRDLRALRSLDGHPRRVGRALAGQPGRGAPARVSRSEPRPRSEGRPPEGRSSRRLNGSPCADVGPTSDPISTANVAGWARSSSRSSPSRPCCTSPGTSG